MKAFLINNKNWRMSNKFLSPIHEIATQVYEVARSRLFQYCRVAWSMYKLRDFAVKTSRSNKELKNGSKICAREMTWLDPQAQSPSWIEHSTSNFPWRKYQGLNGDTGLVLCLFWLQIVHAKLMLMPGSVLDVNGKCINLGPHASPTIVKQLMNSLGAWWGP
jgi:hypothetical protein